jgi:hypothetical protein
VEHARVAAGRQSVSPRNRVPPEPRPTAVILNAWHARCWEVKSCPSRPWSDLRHMVRTLGKAWISPISTHLAPAIWLSSSWCWSLNLSRTTVPQYLWPDSSPGYPRLFVGNPSEAEGRQSNRRGELARRRGRKVIACFAGTPSRSAATLPKSIARGLGVPAIPARKRCAFGAA